MRSRTSRMLALVSATTLTLALFGSCASEESDDVGDGVPTADTGATLTGPDVEPTPVQQAWSDLYATTIEELRESDTMYALPRKQCLPGRKGTRLVLSKSAPWTLGGADHRIDLGLTRGSCRAADAEIAVRWRSEYEPVVRTGRELARHVPSVKQQAWRRAHEELSTDGHLLGIHLEELLEEEGRYPATYTMQSLRRQGMAPEQGVSFTYTSEDDGSSYRLCVTHDTTGAWRSYEAGPVPTALGDEGECTYTRSAPDSNAALLVDAERVQAALDVPDGETPRTCDDLPDDEQLVREGVLSPGNTVADCRTRDYEATLCVQNTETEHWLVLGLFWETGTGACTVDGHAKRIKARDVWTKSAARSRARNKELNKELN